MAKRPGEAYWRKHIESWERSGLTQVAYCEKRGLRVKTFGRWRGKELSRAKPGVMTPPVTLVPISVEVSQGMRDVVRLHSPGGWRVELSGSGVPWLADLLRQLP